MNASILIIDDEPKMGKALKLILDKEGYRVDTAEDPRAGLAMLGENQYDVLLCDLKMPGLSGLDVLEQSKGAQPNLNVIMMTAFASAETAVEAMKKGAYDYLIKPFSTDELKILIGRCLETQSLQRENTILREQLQERFQPANTVAVSKAMQSVLNRARKVAESGATVLIQGETGTGKEMLAQIIHSVSPRRDHPLLTVNCGALPESLLEAELFGHKKGAFTGAVESRAGLFEAANKGSIFLDEIGDISPAMQVKLLRVLQSGEFQRVGDPTVIKVNVRVIAATNRDLEKMIAANEFRTDLYYRLNVVPIYVPALRERREDIAPLVDHFIRKFGGGKSYSFTPDALEVMQLYDWPGNIRELENAVEHAIVLSDSDELGIDALPNALQNFAGSSVIESITQLDKLTLDEAERRMLQGAMERANNNMTRAARQLGITRRTLGYRLRKHGLYKPAFERHSSGDDAEGEESVRDEGRMEDGDAE